MSKNTYRSVEIQKVTAAQILEWIVSSVVIFALDVAKRRVLVAIADAAGQTTKLVFFDMPSQLPLLVRLAKQIRDAGRTVQMVLEPTGSYGDPITAAAHDAGIEVFMVSPKRTHDAAEIFDGVPSKHDPKDATIIARLHAQKLSRRWRPMSLLRREMRALVSERELYSVPLDTHLGRVEGHLAAWWPELLQRVKVRDRISVLRWLCDYPDPALVRARPEEATKALRREGHGGFGLQTIEQIVQSATHTQGAAMTPGERQMLRVTFQEVVRLHECVEQVDERIDKALEAEPGLQTLRQMLGATTLGVLLALLGDPAQYTSAQALQKAAGLNLKERSSGVRQNQGLHVTKRGPGLVRKYLYLLAMRMVASDAVVRAWYQRRESFRAEHKLSALVAVMRKLIQAIWHVARGQAFDATRLFDVRRLNVSAAVVASPSPITAGGVAAA